MQNISNHIMYLKGSLAATPTAARICEHHHNHMTRVQSVSNTQVMGGIQELLQHKRILLDGCILRVSITESRTQNMTNLVKAIRNCIPYWLMTRV